MQIGANKRNGGSSNLKNWIKGIPLVGSTARKLVSLSVFAGARRRAFPGSGSFWENRYRTGGTSGSGSYGRLAQFKAEILNEFVRERRVSSIIEFGCGDGAQLELARYPSYVGVDVATVPIERCSRRYARDASKRFYLADALPSDLGSFDLALSLDVIFHLVEDSVFESYMRSLFAQAQRYVIVYSSNHDAPSESPHVRHRNFAAWISKNQPDWRGAGFVANRFPFDPLRPNDTSFADFYIFTR
jgi:Methyltransferase domain